RHRKMSYQPATRVWQEWLSDDGLIGRPLRNLERGTLSSNEATEAARVWQDEHEVRALIRQTDYTLRNRQSERREIEAAAAEGLQRNATEAAELFAEAAALLAPTATARQHIKAPLGRLREAIRRAAPAAVGLVAT